MIQIAGGLTCALAASLALNWWLWTTNGDLQFEVAKQKAAVASCSARVRNLLEDKESDSTVTDPSGFDVPDRWIVPDGNPTGR